MTGGNPLLVSELLAAGPSDVPPTVRDLMLARLAPLPEPARAVARLVAVMPGHADPAVLAGSAAAVETCVARGVLVAADGRVAYRHELLRRAVEESLSPVRRAELHAAVLAALDGTADPARLAHHARLAGDVPALLRHAPAAARRAAAVNARREAVGHLRAALPHVDRLPEPSGPSCWASSPRRRSRPGSPRTACRRCSGRWRCGRRPATPSAPAPRCCCSTGSTGGPGGWTRRGRRAGGRSRCWRPCPPGRQLAVAYGQLSSRYMLTNQPEQAMVWGRRAIALAERLGDVATAVDGLINVGGARFDLEPDWDGAELERAHAAAEAAGLPDQATRSLVNLGSTTLQRGEHGRAAPQLDRALRVAAGPGPARVRPVHHGPAGPAAGGARRLGRCPRRRRALPGVAGAGRQHPDPGPGRAGAAGRLRQRRRTTRWPCSTRRPSTPTR